MGVVGKEEEGGWLREEGKWDGEKKGEGEWGELGEGWEREGASGRRTGRTRGVMGTEHEKLRG